MGCWAVGPWMGEALYLFYADSFDKWLLHVACGLSVSFDKFAVRMTWFGGLRMLTPRILSLSVCGTFIAVSFEDCIPVPLALSPINMLF